MGIYTMRTPSDAMSDCRTPGCDESMDQDDMTECERCDREYCRDCSTDFRRGVCLGCSEDEDEDEDEAEDDGEEFHGEVMERLDVLCALADAVAEEMARPEELIGADTIEALTRAKAALDAATDAAFAHAREAAQ